ncbi:hypothetical protein M569_00548, partial [Genlisea aurea]
VSFKYWDDCVDPDDLQAMWLEPEVRTEWIAVGETEGSKVHLSRDPDGHPYLTQTEMRAVAGIIVRRHFVSQIDSDMLCAIAELESDRQPLSTSYNKKSDEVKMGIMQISPTKAQWLIREMGFRAYDVGDDDTKLLYKPFLNVYLAAAHLKWLSCFEQKERSEEFMVRAYNGGTKKATHKSTLPYWKKYLCVKERLPSRLVSFSLVANGSGVPQKKELNFRSLLVPMNTTWESRTSAEDMEEMWNNSEVSKEWIKSGEKKGKVRFSHDLEKQPYLSRVELRAVAEIVSRMTQFTAKPSVLCALSEMVSMRFVNGTGQRTGLMGIDYPTARWLYKDLGYRGYAVESVEDLSKPFVSMYFGAAYMKWLSEYEGRERTLQFVVQAYLSGPQNANNLEETGPLWSKFEEVLSRYESNKR